MSIGRQAILGVLWSIAGKFFGFLVNFAGQLLLVRLILPSDFGSFALALSALRVITVIMEPNFPWATIQMREEPELVDTAFALCLIQGVLILVVSIGIAIAVGRFHPAMSNFSSLLMLLGTSYAVAPLVELYAAQLEKDFRYRTRTIAITASGIFSTGAAVFFAVKGYGIWSLAAREVLSIFTLLILYQFVSGKLFHFTFKKEAAIKLINVGGKMLAASSLIAIFSQTDIFLIGASLGIVVLGYYSQARYLVDVVHSGIWEVNAVSLPVYVRLKNDPTRLSQSYLTLNFFLTRLMLPISIILFLFPTEIISLLFGDRWKPAGEALRYLALCPVVVPLAANLESFLYVIGEIAITAWFRGAQIFIAFGLITLGARTYGLAGASVGFMFSLVAGLLLLYIRIRRRHALTGMLQSLRYPLFAAALSVVCVFMLKGGETLHSGKFFGLMALAVALFGFFLIVLERRELTNNVKAVVARLKTD